MKSWKTTVAGVGAILAGLAMAAKAVSAGDYSHAPEIIAAIMAGFAGVFARDNNVTSERAGAK
jgi:hypothetical protein